MGGPGLFPIYMGHSFFIILLSWCNLHTPNIYIMCILLGTVLLAGAFFKLYQIIDTYMLGKNR